MSCVRSAYPSETAERFQVRLPDGLRDEIRETAGRNRRSMNAEIIHRLERKGPASAATDPDRGSTHPAEDQSNMETNTITPAPAASDRSWFEFANRLEQALYTIRDLNRIAEITAVEHFEEVEGRGDTFQLPALRGEEIISLVKASARIATLALEGDR